MNIATIQHVITKHYNITLQTQLLEILRLTD